MMFVIAILISAFPSYRFIDSFITNTLHPIAEFDSNEVFNFVDDDPYTPYYLSMSVTSRDAELPEMGVSITNAEGEVEGDPINRWNSVMGREYKQFLTIPKQPDGKFAIEVTTEESEDLLIYRRVQDVVAREIDRAKPFWFISLIPLLLGVGPIFVMLVRAVNNSSKVELHVSK